SLTIFGKPGDTVRHTLTVSSPEKRPVYARAASNRPWLKVAGVKMEGRTATVQLAVPSVPAVPGETLEALVMVTSNGNQQFGVPAGLRVAGTRPPGKSIPVLELDPVPLASNGPVGEVVPETIAPTALPAGWPGRDSRITAPVARLVPDPVPVKPAGAGPVA